MRRWAWGLALAGLVLPVAAASDSTPQVVQATPGTGGGTGGAIERFTLRFSDPMVPLGDPRAAAPATSDCPVPTTGRWIDPQAYVFEFAQPLPGGISCAISLRDDVATARGVRLAGTRRFAIDTGGPAARAVLAPGLDGSVDEDQVFLVATNVPADPRSVAARAYCAVDGIGETIAVDLLPADTAARVIAGLGEQDWRRNNFLDQSGLPQRLPADVRARRAALPTLLALKCRRPLPPQRDMALVWPGSITNVAGKPAGRDQRFDFSVRAAFTARFVCPRVNPRAGCDPVQAARVEFTAPVPRAQAMAMRLRLPDGSERAPVTSDDDRSAGQLTQVRFDGPFPERAGATLRLPQGLRDIGGRPLANAERFPLAVRFDAMPPLVKFAASFGIVEAGEGGVLPVTVRAIEPRLIGRLTSVGGRQAQVADDDKAIAEWLRRIEEADDEDYRDEPDGKGGTRTINDTGSRPILTSGARPLAIGLPGHGKAFEVIGIPLRARGFHVVELASPALGAALLGRRTPRYVAAGALVTNMAVHFKWGREASLVWVTSLDKAQPVAGAVVRVSDSCTGTAFATGRTDAQGRLLIRRGLPQPESYGSCTSDTHPLMISARAGGDMSFTLTSWNKGIAPYDFDLPYGWSARGDIVHTLFDRMLLKAGETVNMKHLLRRPVGGGFMPAGRLDGTLRLVHRGSDTEFTLPLHIGSDGIGESRWTVPVGAPMGDYDLRIEAGGKMIDPGQSIRVDSFRLPTMRASIDTPRPRLVRPASVPLSLYAGYLSGGGAAGLPVTLRTGFSAVTSPPEGWEAFTFGGQALREGTRRLDDNGEAEATPLPYAQTLPATLDRNGAARAGIEIGRSVDDPLTMTVEMDYDDANGETLTTSRQIGLYPSAVQLGLRTDGWLMRDDDLRLDLVTLDLDGKPVAGRPVELALYSREIITARRRLIGGFYAYDNQEKVTRLKASCSTRGDRLGRARCVIDAGVSGEVTVVATTTDADGHVARAVRSLWLAGDDDWWFGGDNGDRMDLVPEQTAYKAGETARLQVRMPFRSATALVTVEREGVLSSFVTELSGKDPVVEVKLPGAYAPNVYVSVMAVRGRIGGWRLWLADLARRWHLPFLSREGASPTALVDLAKPSYRIGITRLRVGWEGHRLDVAVRADRSRYAVRQRAAVDVRVTDAAGRPARQGEIAFAAVDEALLQLAPNESWKVLDAMMGERTLDVLTSTAQMQVVGKRHYGRKAVAPGGGGGDASGVTRDNFQPVLLWKGRVTLDGDGRARVAVPLSDALSSFRFVAIATQGAQLFGTGEAKVRTAQDLSIYAGLPPVVRTGDWYGGLFTLRNGSTRPMRVTATMALDPQVAVGRPISVTVPAGGAVPIRWNLHAPGAPERLQWTVTARSDDGRASDRLSVAQEVVSAVPTEIWAATLLRVGAGGSVPIAPPAGALAGGRVEIRLSDSLAPPLDGVRAYMTAYPYNCFEQQLSRAVVLGDSGAWTALAAAIPSYLDGEGLLRYFPSERMEGSPELTAYALSMTAAAGFAIPAEPRARMIGAMQAVVEGRLAKDRAGPADERLLRVAALAALARNGASTPALVGAIDMVPADMPTATLADWITIVSRTPRLPQAATLRATAEAVLRGRIVYEGTRFDLSDRAQSPWWMMVSGDEMAIKALDAVFDLPGWSGDLPRMMAGAAARQWRGHWDTTPANAWGAVVVRRFATRYPASAVAGVTTARLGAVTRTRGWPLPANAAPLSLPLVKAPLLLSQSGGAGPWARVSVRAAVPLRAPLFAGYRLSKSVRILSARRPGRLSQGDVVRVTLTVDASVDRNWVVLSDPLPPGATVIGDLGGQSALLGQNDGVADTQPGYVERGPEAWRGYIAWLPRGRTSISYTMRVNGIGRFALPPSRTEAMYSPEIRAQLPNGPVTVWAR
jgi:hypothetical protein